MTSIKYCRFIFLVSAFLLLDLSFAKGQVGYDFYEGAVDVTNLINSCSADAAYTTAGATPDKNGGSCLGTAQMNRWFKFTAPANGRISITADVGGAKGTQTPTYMTLWQSDGTTQVKCIRNSYSGEDVILATNNLTPSATYYFSVDVYPVMPGTFSLCLSDQLNYDFYEGAIDVTSLINSCSADAAYTTVSATPDKSGGSCLGTAKMNRWFKFTAPANGRISITADVGGSKGTQTTTYMTLWQSDGTTQVRCIQNSFSGEDVVLATSNLTPSATYYFSVDVYTVMPGTFSLCLNDQYNPINTVADSIELSVLKNLYDSLGGPGWTTKTNWPAPGNWPATATAAQMGTWYGVGVTNGDISSISLGSNNLTGKLPSSIGQLTGLVQVFVNSNKLSGTAPASLNSLTRLTHLRLNTNLLTGQIPDLSALSNLLELSINNNAFASGPIPSWISALQQLQILNMSSTGRNGTIPSSIGTLSQLVSLYLPVNSLTGSIPPELGSLSRLTTLQLYQNQLSGNLPASIGDMTKLSTIYLYNNQFSGSIPTAIGNLSNLTALLLHSNQLSGEIPSSIGDLVNLNNLNLSTNQLIGCIPSSIGTLIKLASFSANSNHLTGSIPSSIGNLINLTTLQLSSNQLSGSIPSEIGNLTKLTSLLLHINKLTGDIPSSIGNLVNLTQMYLYTNQLTGDLPSTIGNLTKLVYFSAYGNQFTGSLPPSFANLSALTFLDISNNKLSGTLSPTLFSNLTKIGTINLATNNFTGAFPGLATTPVLTSLTLTGNQFTSLPASSLNLPVLITLSADNNRIGDIPDFSAHVNKTNLTLKLQNNVLDFSQLEPLIGVGIKTLTFSPQKTIAYVGPQVLTTSSDFILTARPKGPFTSNIKWEKLQPNGVSWQDVSSSNADPVTGTTYRIVNANTSAEGKYRWSCTSTTATGFTLTSDPIEVKTPGRFTIDNLAFQYKYDGRRRMIAKKVPGAEWVYMVYDDRDRLVLTQDAEQRKLNKWSFTKYDELNRPILTGIRDTTVYLSQAQMQSVVNAHFAKPSARWSETFIGNATGNVHGYSNKAYPVRTGSTTTEVDANKYLTVKYYDTYEFTSTWGLDYLYQPNQVTSQTINGFTYVQPSIEFLRVTGQITGTKIKVFTDRSFQWTKAINYYDDKYRLVQSTSDNYKGGLTTTTMLFDFTGRKIAEKITEAGEYTKWQNIVGLTATDISLVWASGASGWKAGASSVQKIPANSNGGIEWVVNDAKYKVVGLSDQDIDVSMNSIDYGIYLLYTTAYIIENGNTIGIPGGYVIGDVFRIERIDNSIKYFKNNILIKTTSVVTKPELILDISFFSASSSFGGAKFFPTETQSITRTFNYDHAGRLLKTWHSVNGATPILLAQNEYNELGQLVDKKLYSTDNGSNFKQSVDYRYNIRGWLTSINNGQLITDNTNDDSNDLFGMNLHYNDLVSGLTASGDAQYNGNISAIQYSNNQALGTVKSHGYKFGYDPMNRLLSATHKERTGGWNASGSYHEDNLSYDLNGNIKSLSRRGENTSLMDILSYDYGTGSSASNKLLSVSDTGDKTKGFIDGNVVGDDYTYDANGNMVIDKNKSIITSAGAAGITYNYLNLPEKVVKSNGDYIKYVYDASGRKLSQGVYTSANVLKKKTDYVGEYVYENDTLKFINHEEGRVVMTSLSPGEGQGEAEYQYNMKDHLGNVRMTFTTKDDIQVSTATLETANVASEQGKFLNYDEAIKINSLWFDHSHRMAGGASNTTQYATRLTGGNTNATIGLAKSLSVMPGDKIDVEVFAKYLDPNPNNLTQALKDFIASIATGGGAPGGTIIDGGFAGSLGNNVFPFAGFFTHSSESSTSPKAYLNYLVFDRNYVFKTGGYKRVTTAAIETGTDGLHERLYFDGADQIKITEPGYVYIWLSNENETAVEVYFDDFKVTHTKSPVIQSTDLYPFGAVAQSYSRENSVLNKHLYQGKEYQDDLGLNLYDIHWRQYDPWGPHTTTMDPHAENYYNLSPYSWTLNNPVNYTDPDGKDVIFDISRNKKGEITGVSLRATVYITGEGASSERAGELNDMASRIFRPGSSKNGVSISFNVSFKYSKDVSASNLKPGENILTFSSERAKTSRGDKTGKASHVNASYSRTIDPKTKTASYEQFSGRTGIMYGDERYSHVNILHETLHFLGLSDRYDNEQVGKPDQGYENDIMGTRGSTNIGNAHFDNYGNYIRSINPTGSSYLNKKTVDKDSRGHVISPTKKELDKR
jgi:RHS repeat-associated protein